MVIVDRLLKLLAERWRFRLTRWSVLRILAVMVLTLALLSWVLPDRPGSLKANSYNREFHLQVSRNVTYPLGDTRGFANATKRGRFNVAWIGGSEILRVQPGHRSFIPELVTQRLGKVRGRKIWTSVYFMNAIRLTDELTALESALATKPKLVVVSLNPLWVLNDAAVQGWPYLNGILARNAIWPPSRWPVAASLLTPGDVGWRFLSAVSRPVRERYNWGVRMASRTGGLTFLKAVTDPHPPAPTAMDLLNSARPVDFFLEHSDSIRIPVNADILHTQEPVLEREMYTTSSFNAKVLQQMFEMVRRAGVRAYFYVPPINEKVAAIPKYADVLAELTRRLAEVTRGQTTSRVVFDPAGLQSRVPPMKFEDIIHVYKPAPEVEIIRRDLCDLLTHNGIEPTGCAR